MILSVEQRRRMTTEPDLSDRAYALYCSIAREVFGREPISRERWDAIPRRSYFRSTHAHDDGQFDHEREQAGDAQ